MSVPDSSSSSTASPGASNVTMLTKLQVLAGVLMLYDFGIGHLIYQQRNRKDDLDEAVTAVKKMLPADLLVSTQSRAAKIKDIITDPAFGTDTYSGRELDKKLAGLANPHEFGEYLPKDGAAETSKDAAGPHEKRLEKNQLASYSGPLVR